MSTPLSSTEKVGVIVPSSFEMSFVDTRALGGAILSVTGMGKLNGASGVYQLRAMGAERILLTGFAGGLRGLRIGDVVNADGVIEGDYDAKPLETVAHVLAGDKISHGSRSWFITQDRFLMRDIYGGLEAETLATDMESYGVVHAARRLGVPVFVVKVISDLVDENAEHDFLKACTEQAGRLNDTISTCVKIISKGEF